MKRIWMEGKTSAGILMRSECMKREPPRRASRPASSGRMERNGVPTRVTRLFFQASPRNMA